MDFEGMGDRAVLAELGERIRRERLNRNLTQAEVAGKAGVAERTVRALEAGGRATVETLIRVFRAMGRINDLDAFLPEPGLSPNELLKLRGRIRQRASRPRGRRAEGV